MKYRITPEMKYTHMEWLNTQDLSDSEVITIATLFDGLLSLLYCMSSTKPISTDMIEWRQQADAYHDVLEHMLSWQEYSAMLTYIETLKGE